MVSKISGYQGPLLWNPFLFAASSSHKSSTDTAQRVFSFVWQNYFFSFFPSHSPTSATLHWFCVQRILFFMVQRGSWMLAHTRGSFLQSICSLSLSLASCWSWNLYLYFPVSTDLWQQFDRVGKENPNRSTISVGHLYESIAKVELVCNFCAENGHGGNNREIL